MTVTMGSCEPICLFLWLETLCYAVCQKIKDTTFVLQITKLFDSVGQSTTFDSLVFLFFHVWLQTPFSRSFRSVSKLHSWPLGCHSNKCLRMSSETVWGNLPAATSNVHVIYGLFLYKISTRRAWYCMMFLVRTRDSFSVFAIPHSGSLKLDLNPIHGNASKLGLKAWKSLSLSSPKT